MEKRVKRGLLFGLFFIMFLLLNINTISALTTQYCNSCSSCNNLLSNTRDKEIILEKDLNDCRLKIKQLRNSIFDCKGHSLISLKNFGGSIIDIEGVFGVTIKNCEIIGNSHLKAILIKGNYPTYQDTITIQDSIIKNARHGIYSDDDVYIYIRKSYIANNYIGIHVKSGKPRLNIHDSVITKNDVGIYVDDNMWGSAPGVGIYDSTLCGNTHLDLHIDNGNPSTPKCDRTYINKFGGTYADCANAIKNCPSWLDNNYCMDDNEKCSFHGLKTISYPLFQNLKYCPMMNEKCGNKDPSYKFCVGNDAYDCLRCGGEHFVKTCSLGCSNGKCVCRDTDYGNPNVKGTCTGQGQTPQEDKCDDQDPEEKKLIEWKCSGERCTQEEITCDYKCDDGACIPGPCELSYVEFSSLDCPNEGCNVGNKISTTATYTGCEEVENIQIPVKGGNNPNCNFVISSFCDPTTGGCAGIWTIPTVSEECIGETIFFDETKTAAIYNKNEVKIAETRNVGGEFKFIDGGALTLQYIDLWPEDKTIKVDDTISYHLDAFYADSSGQLIKKEVTWDFYTWTDYTSSDYDVATNIEVGEYIYTFKGLSKGQVTITGYFPIDLIGGNKKDWTKTDDTNLNVEDPNDCSIISLEIPSEQPGCGNDGKCDEGEKIDINLELHSLCRNNYAKKIIIDFKDMEGNTQCNFEAESNEISFGNEGSCIYEGGIYECDLEWEIPSGFFKDFPLCNGVKATAHFAELFNNINNFLDSKQGEPPDYFGFFKLWGKNIPPVAKIVKPTGSGGVPVDGIPGYLPGADVLFRDESYDEDGIIIKWDWHYRFGLGEWILLNHFTQQNYEQEFTKSFDLSGTYQVKLKVEDNENAVDEDMKNFVITDGKDPIIIPDSPDSNIIQPRKVLLNVSESYDPPIEYKEMKERLGDFFWEFDDNSVPGTFRDNWTYASNFTHILTNPQELYEFNLTLYDKDSPPNSAYYKFIFRTWRCYDGNEILFADGSESESCFSSKPLYCTSQGGNTQTGIGRPDENCQVCKCPSGQHCLSTGHCDTHDPSTCNDLNEDNCFDEPGCWWDECTSCITNPPASCSSYKDERFCNADKCVVGYEPTSQGECGSWVTIEGETYYIDCKGCDWDNGECIQDYELKEQNGQGSQQCHESRTYGDCVGGYMNVEITTECCGNQDTGTICEFSDPPYQISFDTTTETQVCGIATRKLPGFGWLNFIIVIFLISVYYVIIILKKR